MFYVQLAPLEVILGPLKSVLIIFLLFFIRQNYFETLLIPKMVSLLFLVKLMWTNMELYCPMSDRYGGTLLSLSNRNSCLTTKKDEANTRKEEEWPKNGRCCAILGPSTVAISPLVRLMPISDVWKCPPKSSQLLWNLNEGKIRTFFGPTPDQG